MSDQNDYIIYKSELNNQYFVRYAGAPEKEITKAEYQLLQEEKERRLENKINEQQTFEQKPKRKIISTIKDHLDTEIEHDLIIFEHSIDNQIKCFEYGTVTGNFYETKDTIVVEHIFNEVRGNGDFVKCLNLLYAFNLLNQKKGIVIVNLNQQFIDKITDKIILYREHFKIIQLTKHSLMIC